MKLGMKIYCITNKKDINTNLDLYKMMMNGRIILMMKWRKLASSISLLKRIILNLALEVFKEVVIYLWTSLNYWD